MVKRFKSIPLLCLFIANLILAIASHFRPLNILVLCLSGFVLGWEIIDTMKGGN